MSIATKARTRIVTGAIFALVFTAGLLVGFAVDRWSGEIASAAEAAQPEASEETGGRGLIIDRVELSELQRVRVDSILEHHRGYMAAFQDDYRPRYWAIVDSTRSAVKEILTIDQRVLYDSLLAINDENRREGSGSSKE